MIISLVPSKDMQIPPTAPLRNSRIFMKDAQCAETNEKYIFRFFRFLFFELWSILFTISSCFTIINNQKKKSSTVVKFTWKMNSVRPETNEKSILRLKRFLVFEIWSFLYSQLVKNNNSKNKNRKIDFPFVSAHCASSIKTGSKLRG